MESSTLKHFGIRGMHWGIRRYQNKDGTLTPAGKERYSSDSKFKEKIDKDFQKGVNDNWWRSYNEATEKFNKNVGEINKKYEGWDESDDDSGLTYFDTETGRNYMKELNELWQTSYMDALKKNHPLYKDVVNGEAWMNWYAPFMQAYADF